MTLLVAASVLLLASGATGASTSTTLDQCSNGPAGGTTCTDWVSGNLNASKAMYGEGDSIPYRLRMTNLAAGPHTATVEWDTTKGGKHALDYITSYNRTITGADPCAGFACAAPTTTWAIPHDPNAPSTQIAGNFSLFGGTITAVSNYTLSGSYAGDSSTRVTITFTMASAGNAVLAWGGHIANHVDWPSASSVNITGSPFHTRLIGVDGSGGSQDRALSSDAVIFPATVKIVKHADGQMKTFSFSGSLPAPLNSFTLTDGAAKTPDDSKSITLNQASQFTTYTVAESDPAPAYVLFDITCDEDQTKDSTKNVSTRTATIKVQEGENVICTFLNTQQPGTLTVKKVVVNNNGGNKSASDFSFSVDGGAATAFNASGTNTVTSVPAGPHTITETPAAGYATSYDNCTNVNLDPGGNVTCTITNDDVAPKLTLVKKATNDNGGSALASAWTLTATGDGGFSGTGTQNPDATKNDATKGPNNVKANVTYTLSESGGPSGYTASAWACTGATFANGNQVKLNPGDDATCTITNDDVAPKLTLVKKATNDNGGSALASAWTLTATGDGGFSGTGTQNPDATKNDATKGPNNVKANVTYTLSESGGPSGYTASAWTCTSATLGGPNNDQVTLKPGDDATCTITNNDKQATLVVKKVVINNNGGSKLASDFSFTANGGNPISFNANGENQLTVDAGTYTVTEPTAAGYDASYDHCSAINVAPGGSATCTITNDDQPGKLIVKKIVKNDTGGSKQASDFSFNVNGGDAIPFNASGENQLTVDAGSYTVTEPAATDYTASYDHCSNMAVPNGGTATCTITNDDQPGTLIVKKVVENDDGGNEVASDFSFKVDGGAATPFNASGTNVVTVAAGTHSVIEAAATGYTASYDNCSSVVVPNGGSVTCTVTNDDVAPKLTLVKKVVNDNGGSALASAWTLTASGDGGFSGPGVQNSDPTKNDAGNGPNDVKANVNYALSESDGPAGYTASAWTCTAGSLSGDHIKLNPGDDASCTITNNDVAPKLTLVKKVVNDNGGSALASAWTLTASGASNGFSSTGSQDASLNKATNGPHNVDANVSYTLSESGGPGGYIASAWACTGATLSGADNDQVSLKPGDDATCTITNDDQPATLTVKKHVINDNGDTAVASDFTLSVTGTNISLPSFQGSELGTTLTLDAGNYLVLETGGPSGYGPTLSDDCSGTIANGQTKTCTVTNDDSKSASSGATAQSFEPNDSVTITGRSPSGGDVRFELFDPSSPECEGQPAWSQTVTLGSNGTASTENDEFAASTPGAWRWRVRYAGDQRNEPWTGPCGAEHFTIANG